MGQSNSYISLQDDSDSRRFYRKVRKYILEANDKQSKRLVITIENMSDKAAELGAERLLCHSHDTLQCRTVDTPYVRKLVFEWGSDVRIDKL